MGDVCSSSAPATPDEPRARVRVPYLRKASAWAAVAWFPVCALRVIVATSRCPWCREMYSSAAGGLRGIWQQARCNGCGLRRFEHEGVAFEIW